MELHSGTLEGQVAVVTGAAGGIGEAICLALAHRGARIVVIDVSKEKVQAAADRIRAAAAVDVVQAVADVSSASSVASAYAAIEAETGRIDVLVNNAGVREIKNAIDLAPAEWDRTIGVNLNGPFYCAQEAAKRMRRTGGGAIVNIASVAGLVGIRSRPAYCASKHGLIGLTKVLAFDLAQYGIRVNAVAPGAIPTPMTEAYYRDPVFLRGVSHAVALGNRGTPAAIAEAVAFLCSSAAAYITGVTLPVDGGFLAEKSFAGDDAESFRSSSNST